MCAGPGQPPEPPQRDWRSPAEKLGALLDATTDPTMRQLIDIVLELALDMPEDTIDDLQSLRTDVGELIDRLDSAEDRLNNLELEG